MDMPGFIPSPLTKEQIEEFQEMYFEVYKKHIAYEEAQERGFRLVDFIGTILYYEAQNDDHAASDQRRTDEELLDTE